LFVCSGKGRPKLSIQREQLLIFHSKGYTAKQMGMQFNCSTKSVYKYLYREGMKQRSKYSHLSDEQLTQEMQKLKTMFPNCGSVV